MAETKTTKEAPESRQEFSNLEADIDKLRADVAELADIVKTTATGKAAAAKEQLGTEAQRALEELQQRLDALIGQGRQTVDQVGEQIGQHPVSSLVGAFGLGFILAMLLERGGNTGSSR